jgi:hypothetical protein
MTRKIQDALMFCWWQRHRHGDGSPRGVHASLARRELPGISILISFPPLDSLRPRSAPAIAASAAAAPAGSADLRRGLTAARALPTHAAPPEHGPAQPRRLALKPSGKHPRSTPLLLPLCARPPPRPQYARRNAALASLSRARNSVRPWFHRALGSAAAAAA